MVFGMCGMKSKYYRRKPRASIVVQRMEPGSPGRASRGACFPRSTKEEFSMENEQPPLGMLGSGLSHKDSFSVCRLYESPYCTTDHHGCDALLCTEEPCRCSENHGSSLRDRGSFGPSSHLAKCVTADPRKVVETQPHINKSMTLLA